ncbi:MAG: hypothetical protein KTR32_43900 [Granulosicoccus sp.]|nr:hypothetical protein [Granulosicoccus sp.]
MIHREPLLIESLRPLPESVAFCATVDDFGHEQVITDLMVRRACEQMDKEQLWPLANHSIESRLIAADKDLPAGGAVILPFSPL